MIEIIKKDKGNTNALQTGFYTQKNTEQRRATRQLMKRCKALLEEF